MAHAAMRVPAGNNVCSRLKPQIFKTIDGKLIVEDEFLNFLVIKMRTLSQDEIVMLASNNFPSECIEESKRLLFEVCPRTTQGCVTHKGPQKDINNIKACLKVLNESGEDIPRFVSHYLDDLPPVTSGSIDVSALLGRIEQLNRDISSLKGALDAQVNVCEDLQAVTVDVVQRVTALEKTHEPAGPERTTGAAVVEETSVAEAPQTTRDTNAMSAPPQNQSQWSTVVRGGRRLKTAPGIPKPQPKPSTVRDPQKRERKNMAVVGTGNLAKALKALKGIGVIHTDIKLDNIMLVDHQTRPFRVKLIDFGLAIPTSKAMPGQSLQITFFRENC